VPWSIAQIKEASSAIQMFQGSDATFELTCHKKQED